MKDILFMIGSLSAGGAEKSLVSLLNTLPSDKYSIDLILSKKEGLFYPLLPDNINVIEAPFPYSCLTRSPKDFQYYLNHGILFWIKKIYRLYKSKRNIKEYALQQSLWKYWRDDIPIYEKKYDIAISFLEGFPNYYIIDKVNANKKFLWIHSEYRKLKYNSSFDYSYFSKADKIITISSICKESLLTFFPDLKNKFDVIENISNPDLIRKMSLEKVTDISIDEKKFKILSVGRLVPVKAFDLALKSAYLLKKRDVNFVWYIIGDGILKKELQKMIQDLELTNNVYLLGLKINPYKYMNLADIIVQSSKYEGKSIAIDEAKILYKPIVSTNYTTVYDVIKNNETGIITDMTPEALSNGIYKLYENLELRSYISENIKNEENNNILEINKYIDLIS